MKTSSSPIKGPKLSTNIKKQAASMPDMRELWATKRAAMEAIRAKSQPDGRQFKRRWELFETLINIFGGLLKASGLYGRGLRNAKDVRLVEHELYYRNLPSGFDGYRVLHLTDLHLDFLQGIEDEIVKALKQVQRPVDLAIFTGDFRERMDSGHKQVLAPLSKILNEIHAVDGKYATLGNHDTVNMIPSFEAMGLKVLANETHSISRGEDTISFTGIDDVHYYYTESALEAVKASPNTFKMLFAHSAELYYQAFKSGYDLYLAGHTHGGQICFPGNFPLITHHTAGRKRARGFWQDEQMVGYTSQGAGAIALPVRFNSHGEVTVFTLKKKTD